MRAPRIKYVAKASHYCLTYFVPDPKGKKDSNQRQEWFDTEEEALQRMGSLGG